MPSENRTSYVICNWNEQARGIVIQLHSDLLRSAGEDYAIVVVDPREIAEDELRKTHGKFFYNVSFLRGDPSDRAVLRAAGVEEARCVMVLAEGGSSGANADARTLLTFFALKNIRETTESTYRVLVEIASSANHEKFSSLLSASVEAGWLEVLPVEEIEGRVFSQAARVPGLSQLYFNLLTFSSDTNEVYRVPVPPGLVGLTFGEAFERIHTMAGQTHGHVVLVGTATGHQFIDTNPWQTDDEGVEIAGAVESTLSETDQLIVFAHSPPALEARFPAAHQEEAI